MDAVQILGSLDCNVYCFQFIPKFAKLEFFYFQSGSEAINILQTVSCCCCDNTKVWFTKTQLINFVCPGSSANAKVKAKFTIFCGLTNVFFLLECRLSFQ